MMKKIFALIAVLLTAAACAGKDRDEKNIFVYKAYFMNVPVEVKMHTKNLASAKDLSDKIISEWDRIAGEMDYNNPYSITTALNKEEYFGQWIKVDDEFMDMLDKSMEYYRMTDGAFDITFAPLWPLWKEAAATKKMPDRDDIKHALSNIGSKYIEIDREKKEVRYLRPVKINLGGLLRPYCFERAWKIIKDFNPPFPVELHFGSNMLVYGGRDWKYEVVDPFNKDKSLGAFSFGSGVIISSSGRDVFVEIEGELYSHILDLRTGYPVENFSSLTVYFPDFENRGNIPAAVLAVMGKQKAFSALKKINGSAAVWVDGFGQSDVFINPGSKAVWKAKKNLF